MHCFCVDFFLIFHNRGELRETVRDSCSNYLHLHDDSCSKTVRNKTNEVVNSTHASGGGRVKMAGGFDFTSASVVYMLFGVVSCLFCCSFL